MSSTLGDLMDQFQPQQPTNSPSDSSTNQEWIQTLSQNLPVVGVTYYGDLQQAATQIEQTMSKALSQNMTGILFNTNTKTFNTSPQDLTQALNLLTKLSPQ